MKCFDEGTIQAFLDGEVDSELAESIAGHLADCQDCAMLVREIEEEMNFLSEALDVELNVPVPSEVLRERIFAEIEQTENVTSQKSVWGIFDFAKNWRVLMPVAASFATLLVVFGVYSVINRTPNQEPKGDFAKINPVKTPEQAIDKKIVETTATETPLVSPNNNEVKNKTEKIGVSNKIVSNKQKPTAIQAKTSDETKNIRVIPANYVPEKVKQNKAKSESVTTNSDETNNQSIEGENDYLQTIASLKQKVDSNKDQVIRPSVRVSFERDLAMADKAIETMRKNVKKNPKDDNAKRVLFNSYQNKIDLLSAVTNKSELLATIR